jgi:hypothetical protein
MNMKRLLTVFFIVTIAFLVSSCAVFYPNQKKLIGTWKAVKVEKLEVNVPTATAPAAGTEAKTRTGTGEAKSSAGLPDSAKVEKQISRMIDNEMKSTLTINADKTAIKEYPGKTVHATWKLKKRGTRLLVNTKETGKKLTLDILHINDTSVIVKATVPYGSMKVTYRKEKK